MKNTVAFALALILILGAAGMAYAATPVTLKGEAGQGYGRILVLWPDADADAPPGLEAEIKNGVLIARFARTFSAEPKVLLADLPDIVALARLDADERTLRVALRGTYQVRTSRSYNIFAIDLIAPGTTARPPTLLSKRALEERRQAKNKKQTALALAEAEAEANKPGPALPLKVRAAETSDYTRIAFDWTKPVGHTLQVADHAVELVFDRPAIPDLSVLNVKMPRGIVNAVSHFADGKTFVTLNLAPGIRAKSWNDGTRVIVDIFWSKKQDPSAQLSTKPPVSQAKIDDLTPMPVVQKTHASAIDPTPKGGVVRAQVSRSGANLDVKFSFAAPVGSAAFRRADTITILFDDDARLDIEELEHGASHHIRHVETFRTAKATGVRFQVPPATQIEVQSHNSGAQWTFAFGEKISTTPGKLKLRRDADGSEASKLIAELPNVTAIHVLKDPAIGDQLRVATALGPITGIQSKRHFVEVNALPSAQGLAFEVNADDVFFQIEGNQVIVQTHDGLSLTPTVRPIRIASGNRALSSIALPARNATPGFIDFKRWSLSAEKLGFNAAYDAQLRQVAAENTDPQLRIGLARFLIANGLGAEALGILSLAQRLDPMLVQNAEFRALRGTANLLMGRIKDARADFSARTLNRDPSAALWRGYLAAQMEDWGIARREFDSGREAFYLFVPEWQARFRNAYARAALELNDLGAAKHQLDEAMALDADKDVRTRTRLVEAAFVEASGDANKAIRLYQNVADAGYEPLQSRALFEKARLQTEAGTLSPSEAANVLEDLRYRWRGDTTELEEVRTLGKIYGELGDHRQALEAMNTAIKRFPDSPVTRRIAFDMQDIFNELFLNGGADTMDPVQALALFYQFIELVPIGTKGDRMLRLLADRLIGFDLLPQAIDLLQHQVDNRIRNGQARAKVAAKLALVYMMDHKPEKALIVIRATRNTKLPKALSRERRLIEARAYTVLGRGEQAMELIETDRTPEAAILRANIAWQSKDWAKAGPIMLTVVERYLPRLETLNAENSALILRTAITLSLGNNRAGLNRLREQFSPAMEDTRENEAFIMVTKQEDLGAIPVKKLAPMLAKTENLSAVLKRYQERFEARAQTNTGTSASGAP